MLDVTHSYFLFLPFTSNRYNTLMHFQFNDAFDSDAVSALKINSMNKFSFQNAFRSSIPSILNGSIKTFRHFDGLI